MVDNKSQSISMNIETVLYLFFSILGSSILVSFCVGIDSGSSLWSSLMYQPAPSNDSILCVHYFYFNSISFGGVFSNYLIPMLSTVPYALLFCLEHNNNLWIYKLYRSGSRRYCLKMISAASISGGIVVTMGHMLFLIVLAQSFPLITEAKLNESTWIPYYSLLSNGNGILYFVICLNHAFLSGALYGALGMCISAFYPDIRVTFCAPMFIRFLLVQIEKFLGLPDILRIDRYLNCRTSIHPEWLSLFFSNIVTIGIILYCLSVYKSRIKKRVENAL